MSKLQANGGANHIKLYGKTIWLIDGKLQANYGQAQANYPATTANYKGELKANSEPSTGKLLANYRK